MGGTPFSFRGLERLIHDLDFCHKACKSGELPSNVNIVRLYQTAPPTERMVNATQENRIDPLDPLAVYRVMRICMAMGQAAGAAASIMTHTGDSTRTLDASRIRQHLKARGVQL